jgi:hypothetical protein
MKFKPTQAFIMRHKSLVLMFLLGWQVVSAQFSTDKVQVSFGYGIHNAAARRFNHLITTFNNNRYPLVIATNLNNINWLTGFEGGGHYLFTEDIRFHAQFGSRRQFLQSLYADSLMYRQYLFRIHTVDLGADYKIGQEGPFTHWVGGGLVVGVMGVFTNFTSQEGYAGSRTMIDIDHTAVIGLSVSYEAQLKLHQYVHLYVRPTAQYAIPGNVRKLTDFFDPQVSQQGVSYGEGEPEKYDTGSLNGIGVSGGIILQLPEF